MVITEERLDTVVSFTAHRDGQSPPIYIWEDPRFGHPVELMARRASGDTLLRAWKEGRRDETQNMHCKCMDWQQAAQAATNQSIMDCSNWDFFGGLRLESLQSTSLSPSSAVVGELRALLSDVSLKCYISQTNVIVELPIHNKLYWAERLEVFLTVNGVLIDTQLRLFPKHLYPHSVLSYVLFTKAVTMMMGFRNFVRRTFDFEMPNDKVLLVSSLPLGPILQGEEKLSSLAQFLGLCSNADVVRFRMAFLEGWSSVVGHCFEETATTERLLQLYRKLYDADLDRIERERIVIGWRRLNACSTRRTTEISKIVSFVLKPMVYLSQGHICKNDDWDVPLVLLSLPNYDRTYNDIVSDTDSDDEEPDVTMHV